MRPIKGAHAVDLHVGARVRARRKALKLTQMQLAQKLGITFQQVQKYERGCNRISASKLFDIGQELSMHVSFFFEGYASEISLVTDQNAPTNLFLHSPEGLDLSETFLRISNEEQRRCLLDLMKALAAARPFHSEELNKPAGP